MDNRFQVLKRYNPYAIRKIYPGIRHEVIHEQAFYMFDWLMTVSQKDRSTHLIKEDFLNLTLIAQMHSALKNIKKAFNMHMIAFLKIKSLPLLI
ncbi:MAG: hypothetical protein IPG24_21400 [Leptospiraceae bacterium]|nr:hypothetical protein [Leptospiraceae bacterium]